MQKSVKFSVRFATKRDLTAVSKFGTPVVKSMKFYNKEHTARNIYELSTKDLSKTFREHKNSIVIAVTEASRVIGFCTHFPGHGHVDWLDWLLVDGGFRKLGVGRALIDFVMQDAKKRGCHKVWCDTNPHNKNAVNFFTRMGFRRIGVAQKHAFREDEIFWEKQIG